MVWKVFPGAMRMCGGVSGRGATKDNEGIVCQGWPAVLHTQICASIHAEVRRLAASMNDMLVCFVVIVLLNLIKTR
jgi:hypothetical protein